MKDMNEELITAVSMYPLLYDASLASYRSLLERNATWRVVSDKTGVPVDACRSRWKQLRDRFRKEVKGQKGSHNGPPGASKPRPWRLMAAMAFLGPFVEAKEAHSNPGRAAPAPPDAGRPLHHRASKRPVSGQASVAPSTPATVAPSTLFSVTPSPPFSVTPSSPASVAPSSQVTSTQDPSVPGQVSDLAPLSPSLLSSPSSSPSHKPTFDPPSTSTLCTALHDKPPDNTSRCPASGSPKRRCTTPPVGLSGRRLVSAVEAHPQPPQPTLPLPPPMLRDEDEDTYFLLSLVPALRRLSAPYRRYLKRQFLELLNRAEQEEEEERETK